MEGVIVGVIEDVLEGVKEGVIEGVIDGVVVSGCFVGFSVPKGENVVIRSTMTAMIATTIPTRSRDDFIMEPGEFLFIL